MQTSTVDNHCFLEGCILNMSGNYYCFVPYSLQPLDPNNQHNSIVSLLPFRNPFVILNFHPQQSESMPRCKYDHITILLKDLEFIPKTKGKFKLMNKAHKTHHFLTFTDCSSASNLISIPC